MNIFLVCFILFIFLQGCSQNQGPSSENSVNEDAFKNYVNSNTPPVTTNESKPLVNVAF